MTNALHDFWATRSERERRVLFYGGIAVIAVIVMLYVLLPLHMQRKQLRTSLPKLRAEAVALERAAQEAKQLKTATVAATNPADRQSFEDAASIIGLASTSYQIVSSSGDRTAVRITQAPFDRLLAWIDALQTHHRLRVEAARLQAQSAPGTVSGEIEFVAASTTP